MVEVAAKLRRLTDSKRDVWGQASKYNYDDAEADKMEST